MGIRRSKNYWEYRARQQKRRQFSIAVHEARWGKAIVALLMCVATFIIVMTMSPKVLSGNAAMDTASSTGQPIETSSFGNMGSDGFGQAIMVGDEASPVPAPTPAVTTEPTPEPTATPTPMPEISIPITSCAPKADAPPAVALTFDDGPSHKTTPRLLDELKKRNIKATFFILGVNTPKNTELLQRMAAEGHEIGNHSYGHKNLIELTDEEQFQELDSTRQIIQDNGGQGRMIRPPYGKYDKRVLLYAQERDYRIITWNIDTEDWQYKGDDEGAQKMVDHVLSNVKDGDIILMHDIYSYTVDAATILMDELPKRGFQLMTVEELITR